MKRFYVLIFVFTFVECHSAQSYNIVNQSFSNTTQNSILDTKKWIHRSTDCTTNKDSEFEVFRYNETSYILRQNKCLSFDAPFIDLLLGGTSKTLVLDTGAVKEKPKAPLFDIVTSLASNLTNEKKSAINEIVVIHSYIHSDHNL